MERAPEHALVGLAAFSEKFAWLLPPTADHASVQTHLRNALSAPQSLKGGSTAIWDALISAAAEPLPSTQGDSLYVLSDGGDDASRISSENTAERLATGNVRVFGFVIQHPDKHGSKLDEERLESVIKETGGSADVLVRKPKKTPPAATDPWMELSNEEDGQLRAQFNQISTYYQVEISLPEPLRRSADWKLKMIGTQPRDLAYPRKLTKCAD